MVKAKLGNVNGLTQVTVADGQKTYIVLGRNLKENEW
jgi:hypothetical protein